MPPPDPEFAKALAMLQQACDSQRRGQTEDADILFRRVVKKHPDYFDALHLYGLFKREQGKLHDALHLIDKAIKVRPQAVSAHNSFGVVLCQLGRCEEALTAFDRALTCDPSYLDALNNRGDALAILGRYEQALAIYNQALAVTSNHVPALVGRSNMHSLLGQHELALAGYDRVLALRPGDVHANFNKAKVHISLKQYSSAIASLEHTLTLQPEHVGAFEYLSSLVLTVCDFDRADRIIMEMERRVRNGTDGVDPFTFMLRSDDAALQQRCAQNRIRDFVQEGTRPLWRGRRYQHDRIRVAYLSADFRQHATARLMVELFETHDRKKFEISAISYGPDDGSKTRARLIQAFDQFHDVQSKSNQQIAQLINNQEIDIAVDLMGHTAGSRPTILSYRPAPVQVAYLGFPGTVGAPFIDYILADKFVAPFDQQRFFSERIVHLPNSYQVNVSQLDIAATPSRESCGLPDNAFIFCSFNNSNKITARVFDVWMRVLSKVDGSVLWQLAANAETEINLHNRAKARGVDPARIIFARHVPIWEHLARHRLADLFIDTLPCNAHTTASDALWAGLPLLTCRGQTFTGRVATSLLHAVGCPELVTDTLDEYEARAIGLASDGQLLSSVRNKLKAQIPICSLFNAEQFRRHIEVAYAQMYEISQLGGPPREFAVKSEA